VEAQVAHCRAEVTRVHASSALLVFGFQDPQDGLSDGQLGGHGDGNRSGRKIRG
jgi:hypothetical protein